MVFLQETAFFDTQNTGILVGTSSSDQILGLEGNDFIFGAEEADQLFGNSGADTIYGHQGNDLIHGGSEADLLFGGQGDDVIFGDAGNDTIYGNKGTDILIGGEGEDLFVLEIGSGNFNITATDLIFDFNVAEDQIELKDGLTFEDLSLEGTPAGDTAIIDINSGEILALLQGVNSETLTPDIFLPNPSNTDTEEPITLSLANDTGLDNNDNITSDPTLTGTVTNDVEIAGLEISLGEEFVSIEADIADDGSFTLTQNQLEEALDISFTDGIYTVQLRTVDSSGLRSLEVAEITFTIAPDDNNVTPGELVPPGTDFIEPTITAELANDTGTNDSDGITSDPTITGTATDNFGIAEIEVSIGEAFVPIQTNIAADGSFTLTQNQLEAALNTSFVDDSYTVFLRAVDTSELRSRELAEVTFTLDPTPPTITAQLANDTGDSNSDRITTDATIIGTVSDDNEIVALRAGSDNNLLDVTNQLEADGGFEFDPLQIEAFLGETLVENQTYTLKLEAEDEFGLVSQTTVNFTFADIPDDTTPAIELPPPEEVQIINDDDNEIPPQTEIEEREVTEDPGNTSQDALEIAVSSNGLMYSEQLSGDDLEDIYTFTLGAAGNISIDLNGLSSDADLFLLDSNQTIIDSSEVIGITSESITRPIEAGTYFIQVKSFDGETTDYDLNVAFTSRIPGIDLTGSNEGLFEIQSSESSQLINLEPSPADPNLESFRTDPRFEGIDGSNFSVVIIDTGIDLDHPFFGPDNNGDGVADRIVYHQDFFDTDGDKRGVDSNGHGSHVSSIIASEDNLYPGIAPGANIIHLKVFPDGGGGASPAALEQALSWVVENTDEFNIASVNMSLGGFNFSEAITPDLLEALDDPTSPSIVEEFAEDFSGISQLLEEIVAQDVIVVSASGNNFFGSASVPGVAYPSADINSLSVGAVWDRETDDITFWDSGAIDFTADADRIASFSQRDPILTDIFAPGPFSIGADADGGITTEGDTSQAAAHISGIAVLAQQLAVETLGRRLTFDEFRTLIQDTGETIFDGDDEDDNVVNTEEEYKRVDVLALGEAILELEPTTELPEEPGLVRYDFAYLYDGESFDNDYYFGYTYAEPGTFNLNTLYDDFFLTNETGSNGLYFVFDNSGEVPDDAILNWVYVDTYVDQDSTGEVFTPFYFENGFASGFNGLGSEYDFISLEDGTFDDFGLDFYDANGVEQIFSNTRFTRTDYLANSVPGDLVNADLDNDGADELIVANTDDFDSGFSILFNEGDGTFERPLDFTTDFFSSGAGDDPSLDVGDIDGDGNIDLIAVNPDTNEVSIYFNEGDGDLFTPSTFDAGARPVISETADIDSDGNTDVVLINSEEFDFPFYTGDSLSVLFNRTDNSNVTLPAGEGVRDVVAADLDGDGDVDLATANEVENTVSVLFNRGNITFTLPLTFNVGDRPVNIVADDFDGNGSIDLATSDFGSDTVSVLRNSGNGFFAPAVLYETNEFPSTMTSGDIDGDGDSDLVMRNSVFFDDGDREGNLISVLLNNGDATFSAPISFTVGEVPVGLILEDLDDNGKLDIATSNLESQDVTVYLQS
ncbi:S8 family serine peptidase [Limnoraphis robusta]|uniref:S8 family serine peptidase n=1 Tax=Limnoraphis robusta TaxID=1118279 RepID=UPI002B1F2C59|nr:S8 family serine peptidase [Limnoraphis robusta]MEA5500534.1 S8 family serine peptidase [Limnoraphis robusta BA-68 BA1]